MYARSQPVGRDRVCECNPNNCYNNNIIIIHSLSLGIAFVLAGEVAALGDKAEAPRPEKNIVHVTRLIQPS